jgi:citrate lyase beta subunit
VAAERSISNVFRRASRGLLLAGGGRAPGGLTPVECLTYNACVTTDRLSHLRSLLFVPGSDERKLRKALAAGADAVVADLEDAVAVAEKGSARALTAAVLAEVETESLRTVRVNGADTSFFADDLEAVAELPLDGVVLPKAVPAAVEAVAERLGDRLPVVAIVETAQGLREAYETACNPVVEVLMLGAVDLGLELGLEPRADRDELLFARSKLVLDSAASRIRPPVDAVFVDVRDAEGLEAEARYARSLGLRGKACIHPDQVGVVNGVFVPSRNDAERARRVVEAYERGLREGRGAVALEGEMIDLPVVEQARRILAAAERSSE